MFRHKFECILQILSLILNHQNVSAHIFESTQQIPYMKKKNEKLRVDKYKNAQFLCYIEWMRTRQRTKKDTHTHMQTYIYTLNNE